MNNILYEIERVYFQGIFKLLKIYKRKYGKDENFYKYMHVLLNEVYDGLIIFIKQIDFSNINIEKTILQIFKLIPNLIWNSLGHISDKYIEISKLNIEYFLNKDAQRYKIPEQIPDEIYKQSRIYFKIEMALRNAKKIYDKEKKHE